MDYGLISPTETDQISVKKHFKYHGNMKIIRTPDEYFENLPDYKFKPHYVNIPFSGKQLRMHYVDEGDKDATETVVLLHGQPSWSFLYRSVIPFRTAFSDKDFSSIMLPGGVKHVQKHIRGAHGQNHVTIPNAGHFLQEDQPELVAKEIIRFILENP